MRSFLAAVEGFHTQKFNVQRQNPALSPSTYKKALERVMCKLRLFFPVLFSPSLVQFRFWFVFFLFPHPYFKVHATHRGIQAFLKTLSFETIYVDVGTCRMLDFTDWYRVSCILLNRALLR